MTDEQINAAIAEACPDKFRNEDDVWFFQYAKDCWSQCHNNSICSDLNAMHEAEKMLDKLTEWQKEDHHWHASETYIAILSIILRKYTGMKSWDDFELATTTARQRAEAFLKTLGKWEEATDKEFLTVGAATTEESSVDHLRDATKMMKEVQK